MRNRLTANDAAPLFEEARQIRFRTKGNSVYLRGLIEMSSICDRDCLYCGMRHSNTQAVRYALDDDTILASAHLAQKLNFGTVVLQAGECARLWTRDRVSGLIRRIKDETGQHVTLSLGERSYEDFAAWRAAGAERYLLRFETSDRALFAKIHPGAPITGPHPRIERLHWLKELGYETGTGVMLGIPGQTLESLLDDLEIIAALPADMVGIGPYLADPQTPLGSGEQTSEIPVSADFTCRIYALVRLLLPGANIPSTTALSTLDPKHGRLMGLSSGANVFMPNLTPADARKGYRIYPDKICVVAPEADSVGALHADLASLGLQAVWA